MRADAHYIIPMVLLAGCTGTLTNSSGGGDTNGSVGGDTNGGGAGDNLGGDITAGDTYSAPVCGDGVCAATEACDICVADCGTCDDIYVVEGEHFDVGSDSTALTPADVSGVTVALLNDASGQAAGRVTWNNTRATYTLRTRAGPHRLCLRIVSADTTGQVVFNVTGTSDRLTGSDPTAAWEWQCVDYNVVSPTSVISFSYWGGDGLIDKVVLQPSTTPPIGQGPAALPTCDNLACQVNEDCATCADCCAAVCGDGTCHADENCASCPGDCGACGSVYTGVCWAAADIAAIPPGHWCMVPNSHPRNVEKRPEDWADFDGSNSASFQSYQRVVGFRALTSAWGGGAFDSTRDRLVLFGGGHNDYGGNELIAFDLNLLVWLRLGDPTAFPNRSPDFINPDGTPTSRHTYGSLAYIAHIDRYFAHGGANDSASGTCSAPGTWTFDFAARESAGQYDTAHWELRAGTNEPNTGCESKAVYDPVTERVLYHATSAWWAYDVGTDAWTNLNSDGGSYSSSIALTDRRTVVQFGGGVVDGIWRYDLDSPTLARTELTTTGAKAPESVSNPGAAYDPIADTVVAWIGGSSVYLLDLDTNSWTEQAAAATNAAAPGSVNASGGVYGRFRYSRRLNVYVVADSVDENVFLFRLTQ